MPACVTDLPRLLKRRCSIESTEEALAQTVGLPPIAAARDWLPVPDEGGKTQNKAEPALVLTPTFGAGFDENNEGDDPVVPEAVPMLPSIGADLSLHNIDHIPTAAVQAAPKRCRYNSKGEVEMPNAFDSPVACSFDMGLARQLAYYGRTSRHTRPISECARTHSRLTLRTEQAQYDRPRPHSFPSTAMQSVLGSTNADLSDTLDAHLQSKPRKVGEPVRAGRDPMTIGLSYERLVRGALTVVEQPAERGRFRYAKERRRTPLSGRTDGSFPTVKVSNEFRDQIQDGTVVYASIATRHDTPLGEPVPHWHRLEGKNGESVAQSLVQGCATFSNLVVVRSDRAMYEKPHLLENIRLSDEQQVIRILFTVYFRDRTGTSVRSCVASDLIYGSELKIARVSHYEIPMQGGIDITLLTSKVKKQNIAVKLVDETRDHGCLPGTVISAVDGWRCDDAGRIVCSVQPSVVHHQFALVATLPRYWDLSVPHRRLVEISIVDTTQGTESNSFHLAYEPSCRH